MLVQRRPTIYDRNALDSAAQLNMSHEPKVAYAKTLDVVDLPTFILFDNAGNPLGRWVGEAPTLRELTSNQQASPYRQYAAAPCYRLAG